MQSHHSLLLAGAAAYWTRYSATVFFFFFWVTSVAIFITSSYCRYCRLLNLSKNHKHTSFRINYAYMASLILIAHTSLHECYIICHWPYSLEWQAISVHRCIGYSLYKLYNTEFSFQGQYKFTCPAVEEDTLDKCGAEWSYTEIRKLAVLTAEEQAHFEETMAMLAAAEYCEYKTVSATELTLTQYIYIYIYVCFTTYVYFFFIWATNNIVWH